MKPDELPDSTRYPVRAEALPGEVHSDRKYRVDFARSREELRRIQALRFQVFNLELGEGLESSYAIERDEDPFDAVCHHLLVSETRTGDVVGTYRMQTAEMAATHRGFYSNDEFRLDRLPDHLLAEAVEVGRACVAREHRNHRLLFLLWRGLASYIRHNRKRYLFGCCSLTSQDPALGRQVMAYLQAEGHVHPSFRAPVQPAWRCDGDPGGEASGRVKIPKLFGLYLRYGAKVCSEPALDRQFKTIDYLVVLDVHDLDDASRATFLG